LISEVDQAEVEWNQQGLLDNQLETSTLKLLRLVKQGRRYTEMRKQLGVIECILNRIEEQFSEK
jgi:hypothetical protein